MSAYEKVVAARSTKKLTSVDYINALSARALSSSTATETTATIKP